MKTYRPKTFEKYRDANQKVYDGFYDILYWGKNKVVYVDYSNKLSPEITLTREQFDDMIDQGLFIIN